jgi:hypothetical protein
MDASFSWRKTRPADLPQCLTFRPAKNGSELVGQANVLKGWRKLLEMTSATRSAVVEMKKDGETRIVGFGLAAFVTNEFADAEALDPAPGMNARILASVLNDSAVIATYDQVREANTRDDLQQVTLDCSWDSHLDPEETDVVRILLGRAYQELCAGYHLSRTFLETVDEVEMEQMAGVPSFQVIDRFERFRQAHPGIAINAGRALMAATIESTRVDPYSVGSLQFQHHIRPRFGFTEGEQQLLEAALSGVDDTEAATLLFVSLPAVKRRWERIFERVAGVEPELCPQDGNGTRGTQKRQRILNYVRNHPEELRPFDLSFASRSK